MHSGQDSSFARPDPDQALKLAGGLFLVAWGLTLIGLLVERELSPSGAPDLFEVIFSFSVALCYGVTATGFFILMGARRWTRILARIAIVPFSVLFGITCVMIWFGVADRSFASLQENFLWIPEAFLALFTDDDSRKLAWTGLALGTALFSLATIRVWHREARS